MNRKRLLSISALLLAFSAGAVFAQRPAAPGAKPTPTPAPQTTQPPATTTPPASNAAALPNSKIAIIDSQAFMDPKNGIARFSATLTKLNNEFQKVRDEITALQNQETTLTNEVTKLQDAPAGTPIDRTALNAKIDQLDKLKKDITRKTEDAKDAFERRRDELFDALQQELGRAIEAFAKARGITMVIDRSLVVYMADGIDVTRAFITEFNTKNPVASTAAPRP